MAIDKKRLIKALKGHHKMMLWIYLTVYILCCFVKWRIVDPLYYVKQLIEYIPNTDESGRKGVLVIAFIVLFYYYFAVLFRYDHIEKDGNEAK